MYKFIYVCVWRDPITYVCMYTFIKLIYLLDCSVYSSAPKTLLIQYKPGIEVKNYIMSNMPKIQERRGGGVQEQQIMLYNFWKIPKNSSMPLLKKCFGHLKVPCKHFQWLTIYHKNKIISIEIWLLFSTQRTKWKGSHYL